MRIPSFLAAFSLTLLASAGASAGIAPTPGATNDAALAAAVSSPARTPAFVARDAARHPVEELTFFGLAPNLHVVELWPGGGYWTEILGPYLAPHGRYTVALPIAAGEEEDQAAAKWRAKVAAQKERYGAIHDTFAGPKHFEIAAPDSADLVLTFRNVHNWMDGGYAQEMLAACFRALKPGGILGMEGHRGRGDRPQDPKAESGYVREDVAIDMARKAGFELVGKSEINANPKDTKDWVDGVWTLPPTLSQKDKDRDRYLAVGEADNFVLKFRKPAR
jgi:predicted methyltransferase